MPGGPRGLQNRRRYASGEVGSIPILSASTFQRSTLNAQLATFNSDSWTLDFVHWALGIFFNPESEGCLVALAVFKTVVAA